MKCCYTTKKGPCKMIGCKDYPPNSWIDSHSFCTIHYKKLICCTNVNSLEQFYSKNCAINEQTLLSNLVLENK